MFKKSKTCLSICGLTSVIALLISCSSTPVAIEETTEVKTPVTIASVTLKPIESTVDLPAVSSFMNKSIIRATTTGSIEKVLINQGEYAAPGQLLFTIRTREAMAINNSASADSSLSFKGLINIISHNEGVISSVSYRRGDFVQEGDELAIVSEQSSLVFLLEVPFEFERYIPGNRNCVIVLPDNKKINGIITTKLSDMDMQSQTVKYVVKPSITGNIPGNLIANVSLVKSVNARATVLPKAAILGNETQTEFWVMKLINDSTAVKVAVSIGSEKDNEVEITEPTFLVSDRIVLTGNYGLPDTARIELIKE